MRRRLPFLTALVALLASCGDDAPHELAWVIEFDPPELRERAERVTVSIVEDGCAGAVERWSDHVTLDAAGSPPPTLGPGTYGLRAAARDVTCTTFAIGCVEVTLPARTNEIVVTVREATEEPCDGTCAMGTCTPSSDAGAADAAIDAAAPDGGPDAGPRTIVPSNVDPSVIGFDASSTELDLPALSGRVTLNTENGAINAGPITVRPAGEGPHDASGVAFAIVPSSEAGAPSLGVFVVGALRVPSGVVLEPVGAYPFVLLSRGPVTIEGAIDVSSTATRVGAAGGAGGGGVGAAMAGLRGDGTGGGSGGVPGSGTYDAGGGGGGFGSAGGQGGTTVGGTAGAGGAPYGNATLVPLLGGSGGGAAAGPSRDGGAGGGAVQITSATAITIAAGGTIDAGGAGGLGGPQVRSGSTATSGGGSGGGSGGAILLEAPAVILEGAIGANGGGGGRGGVLDTAPGDGANADASDAPAMGAEGISTGGGGGDGSNSAGVAASGQSAEEGGGGGGGAGRIRINTAAGTESYATLSPSQASGLATVGTITTR